MIGTFTMETRKLIGKVITIRDERDWIGESRILNW